MRYSKEFLDYVNNLPIQEEYLSTFGKSLPRGKFFCPFHTNVNTPAAKVYGNHIKCFSCNRNYSVFDLLKTFNPLRLEELLRTVLVDQGKPQFELPKVIKIPSRAQLDLSGGVSVQLFDFIVGYGKA